MTDKNRRDFLRMATATVSLAPLVGCGGGKSVTETPVTTTQTPVVVPPVTVQPPVATPVSPTTPAPPAVPTVPPVPSVGAPPSFTLSSPATQTAAPFAIGHAFRQGDVPAGRSVQVSGATAQVIPKNYWPDGSLKFALIAGAASLTAATPKTIALATGAALAGAPLALAALVATGITASFTSTFGRASWSAVDFGVPFQTWVSGPAMSSWRYRKPLGSDPQLVAWMEVRLFAGGAVEVLPWVENGYLNAPAPAEKPGTYTFQLGGTTVFNEAIDLYHHARTPLIHGAQLSYWYGIADPQVTPRHDAGYLQATDLVPTYRARPSSLSGFTLPSTYLPLQRGSIVYDSDFMPGGGYQAPIGLLPQHDVLYLVSTDSSLYATVVRNGYSAGRYNIHYRDETTSLPLKFSQYPHLTLYGSGDSTAYTETPKPTGSGGPGWDGAHQPSVGYMAYLLSGWYYFCEETQFVATYNFLDTGDANFLRDGANNKIYPTMGAVQTRAAAWRMRALMQCITVTPDDDTNNRGELIASLAYNVNLYHRTYVAQPNNPFGLINPGGYYSDAGYAGEEAPWQQYFSVAIWGWMRAMKLPVASDTQAKIAAFHAWHAQFAVGMLGPSTGFWYINGVGAYVVQYSPAREPDYVGGTGPWYSSWAEVYRHFPNSPYYTSNGIHTNWPGTTEGVLNAEYDIGAWAASMLGNMQPAIAYAVQFGVAGSADAYNRMICAVNWDTAAASFNTLSPEWSVMPKAPSWVQRTALPAWAPVPGTVHAGSPAAPGDYPIGGGASNARLSFCGMGQRAGEVWLAAVGGHSDYDGNQVTSINLNAEAPVWALRKAASPSTPDVPYYADGTPTSRHTYYSAQWSSRNNRMVNHGCLYAYGSAHSFHTTDGFNPDTNAWDAAGTFSNPALTSITCSDANDDGWAISVQRLEKWTSSTRVYSTTFFDDSSGALMGAPLTYDSKRNQLFSLSGDVGVSPSGDKLNAYIFTANGTARTRITFNPGPGLAQWLADGPQSAGMFHRPREDRFYFFDGAKPAHLYRIIPNNTAVWDIELVVLDAASVMPPTVVGSFTGNRFGYLKDRDIGVYLASGSKPIHYLNLP